MRLRKCIDLLPLTYKDGTEIPSEVHAKIREILTANFGGHAHGDVVHGAYRMAGGETAHDVSSLVWVAVEPEKVDEARQLAARFCSMLKQETIYFEVTDSWIEFVAPDDLFGKQASP